MWAIYPHTGGVGFVPRQCDKDGRALDSYYRDVKPIAGRVWRRYSACRRFADKMSGLGPFVSVASVFPAAADRQDDIAAKDDL